MFFFHFFSWCKYVLHIIIAEEKWDYLCLDLIPVTINFVCRQTFHMDDPYSHRGSEKFKQEETSFCLVNIRRRVELME